MTQDKKLSDQVSRSAVAAGSRLPDKKVSLRFKHSEWVVIAADIHAAKVTTNEYFRVLALDAPVPRRARRRAGGESAKVYARFLGEINKIGSNINQLTRQTNTAVKLGDAGMMPTEDAFLEALLMFGELADELRKELKENAHSAPPHKRVEVADDY